jgi:Zn-dependent protease
MNLVLGFFNMIPFPPLDGSKVLGMFLSDDAYYKWTLQERKGMMWLFAIIIVSNILHLNLIGRIIIYPVQFFMSLLGIG